MSEIVSDPKVGFCTSAELKKSSMEKETEKETDITVEVFKQASDRRKNAGK